MELDKVYKRDEMIALFQELKEQHPALRYTFGVNIDNMFFYRFSNLYEYYQADPNADTFVCVKNLEGESEHRHEYLRPKSAERLDHKQRGYWTRMDSHSREARKIQTLRAQGKLPDGPLK